MSDPAQERNEAIGMLARAVAQLAGALDPRLIPEGGLSFGYAIRGARESSGVAAVEGGIVAGGGGPHAAGPCAFGTDEGIAGIILTAMKFDPRMRSAATIRDSRRARAVLEDDLFLECAAPAPGQVSGGVSTMDWGVASCCRDGVPDAVFRPAAGGRAAVIILFGEDPSDVANNIIICSNRI